MAVPRFQYEVPVARRKGAFAWSLILHVAGIVLVVAMVRWMPTPRIQIQESKLTPLYAPQHEPPKVEIPPVKKITLPPPKVLAKLVPPKIVVPPPQPPPVEVKPKPIEEARLPETITPRVEPKKAVVVGAFTTNDAVKTVQPKKEVVTESFAAGSSALATVQKPPREVQTGGFGDPNGVKGTSERKGLLTVASLGSFDLPAGPGHGNGTGGAHGVAGTVASSGFGGSVAGSGQGDRQRTGTVASAGFGAVPAASTPAPKPRVEEKSSLTPVEVTFKPVPAYTQEARQLHLEGEVLVRVTFGARGDLRVEQVVRGLGHGLDESALRAAQQIRFLPAKRNGEPYDSTALVHIVFALAN
jgi:TonB family protein